MMKTKTGYKNIPLGFNRLVVHASASVTKEKNTIHGFTEVDITEPRRRIREYFEETGEKVPEPIGIKQAQLKTFYQIHQEIREAKKHESDKIGSLSGQTWIRFIPRFLLKTFVRIADKNLTMARRYGKLAITAIGMFSKETVWFIPHRSATVLITVGSIS